MSAKTTAYRYLLTFLMVILAVALAKAQQPDTTYRTRNGVAPGDTLVSTHHDTVSARKFKPKKKKVRVFHPDSLHSPHLAVMHSLIIPGWGQIYNHRWWKVPVIYGGLGLLFDAIIFNTKYYNEFLALSKYREFGKPPQPGDKYYAEAQAYSVYGDQQIYDALDVYRRNRDLSIMGFIGAWGINVVDAYIDAKFEHSFSMDNDLSMKITPTLMNQTMFAQNLNSAYIPGIKITFTF